MPTGKISVSEGSGKNLATHTIVEDILTKELQRIVLSNSSGVEVPMFNAASTTMVTATGAAGAAVTLTIPAAIGLFAYISFIEITAYSTVARVGGVTPVIATTTNIANSPAFTFGSAAAVGTTDTKTYSFDNPLKAAAANVATTIVCPATTSVIWRINVTYFNL